MQIFSHTEAEFFQSLDDSARRQDSTSRVERDGLPDSLGWRACTGSPREPVERAERADDRDAAAQPAVIWVLRAYLGRALAEFVTRHGVMLDVLGMGVLIVGDSGVGKSELALELITRGSGLVADDVTELYHVAPQTLEGCCPELLKDFLEVRGLGMLNIRTIFGETAVRQRKNLKLIVQLERPIGGIIPGLERLPLNASSEEIMGVSVRKVHIARRRGPQSCGPGRSRRAQLRAAAPRHRQHPRIHPTPGAALRLTTKAIDPPSHAARTDQRPLGFRQEHRAQRARGQRLLCGRQPAGQVAGRSRGPACAGRAINAQPSVSTCAAACGLIELPRIREALRNRDFDVEILFLDAKTDTLVKRFSETRRRHPLSDGGSTLTE